MKFYKLTAIFCAAFFTLTGCGFIKDDIKNLAASEESSSDAVFSENGDNEGNTDEGSSAASTEFSPENETPDSEPEILHFVDVFGESYETEILPDVPKHNYDLSAFNRDGDHLTYEDDTYKSRLGVDVSYHQGNIDWNAVKNSGIEFAILRIGFRGYGKEGKIKADSKFSEYIKGAHDAGLDVGVYFFSQAINEDEAAEEADLVLSLLNGETLELPVTYDPESILDDEARTDNVSGEQFTANTKVFCEKISEAGYQPMIYSNMLWEAFELNLSELTDYPIWYADYEPLPQTPYHFSFWQYTNKASVPGISGETDMDIQLINK